MNQLQPDQLIDALRWRYATKQFNPARTIPEDVWQAIEESLVLTPSSFGMQPWKFLQIVNPEIRSRLRAHSWDQTQTTDSSHFLVLTAKTNITEQDIDAWLEFLAKARNIPAATLAPLRSVMAGFIASRDNAARRAWTSRQCYIALGQLMTSAALLGIDTCPLEGIDPAAYDQVLGLEGSGYTTIVACSLGYRADEDKYAQAPKVRYPRESIIERI